MSAMIRWHDAGMPSLLSWDPWRMFEQLDTGGAWPAYDVVDGDDALEVRIDLPGVKESDLAITVTGRTLSIAGQRLVDDAPADASFTIQRRFSGAFERRFDLAPGLDADRLDASLRDGVLIITVPKGESAKPRKVAVNRVVDKVKGLLGSRKAD